MQIKEQDGHESMRELQGMGEGQLVEKLGVLYGLYFPWLCSLCAAFKD